jgi:biopolymer transport protein ExbD
MILDSKVCSGKFGETGKHRHCTTAHIAVSWPDLKSQLQDIFKQRAEKVAFVQGDDEVNFEYVAYVIDTARDAGVERVGLLPKEMASAR